MRLALGTAQFGMAYGINNSVGQVSQNQIHNIIKFARLNKIQTIDTAISYGVSELALGSEDLSSFKIITKLPSVPNNCRNLKDWVLKELQSSLQRLNVRSIYGILIHDTSQLYGKFGFELIQALVFVKSIGLVEKIGISVYDPIDFDTLYYFYNFELVQCPFNLIDRRLIQTGWLRKLKDRNVEVHTRSCFLQGLLIMNKQNIPNKFNKWNGLWELWHEWLDLNSVSAVHACLNYVASFSEIDNIIVGVDTLQQLEEISKFFKSKGLDGFPDISCDDHNLINPSKWRKL